MLEFFKELEQKETRLQNTGAENVKHYTLINNSGYTFDKNGVHYDLRHWLNCYGADVDHYTLYSAETGFKTFDTFEQAIDYIAMI